MPLIVPKGSLVVSVGIAGSGKSSFFRDTFFPEAVVSSDAIRYELFGDASDNTRNAEVFDEVYIRLKNRLEGGDTAVLDATTLTDAALTKAIVLSGQFSSRLFLFLFDTPLEECVHRAENRVDPTRSLPIPSEVFSKQHEQFIKMRKKILTSVLQHLRSVIVLIITPEESISVYQEELWWKI